MNANNTSRQRAMPVRGLAITVYVGQRMGYASTSDFSPQALREGAWPWLGTVVLDSAVMNVPTYMRAPHMPLYDDAFGADPAYWRLLSPWHQWTAGAPPVQMVCSTERADQPCTQADAMARHVRNQGGRAELARLGGDLREHLGATRHQDEVRAGCGEGERRLAPDAARGAGDEDGPSFHVAHVSSPFIGASPCRRGHGGRSSS